MVCFNLPLICDLILWASLNGLLKMKCIDSWHVKYHVQSFNLAYRHIYCREVLNF